MVAVSKPNLMLPKLTLGEQADLLAGSPRGLTSAQARPELAAGDTLEVGEKVGEGLRVFWGNARAKVYAWSDADGWVHFETKGSFGDYFSLSWNFGFDFIESTGMDAFVTVALDDFEIKSNDEGSQSVRAYINVEKGRQKVREEADVEILDGRSSASFVIEDYFELWKLSHSSWVDLVFSGDNVKKVSIRNPWLFAQKTCQFV